VRKTTYLSLVILLTVVFAITGFNFENPSFEENQKEYTLFFVGIALWIIYTVSRLSKK